MGGPGARREGTLRAREAPWRGVEVVSFARIRHVCVVRGVARPMREPGKTADDDEVDAVSIHRPEDRRGIEFSVAHEWRRRWPRRVATTGDPAASGARRRARGSDGRALSRGPSRSRARRGSAPRSSAAAARRASLPLARRRRVRYARSQPATFVRGRRAGAESGRGGGGRSEAAPLQSRAKDIRSDICLTSRRRARPVARPVLSPRARERRSRWNQVPDLADRNGQRGQVGCGAGLDVGQHLLAPARPPPRCARSSRAAARRRVRPRTPAARRR